MKKKILIADDEPEIVNIIKKMLGQHYDVVAAYNGEECFERAIEEKPDLIMLDILMPKLDGWETLKSALKAHEAEPTAERAASSVPFLDERLRFHRAILHLVKRYRLGEAFAPTKASMVLGVPPGGGEADVIIEPRRDGAGISVTLNCVG